MCLTVLALACRHQAHRHVDTFCAEKAADWPLQSLACKFGWRILHLSPNYFSTWLFGYPRISILYITIYAAIVCHCIIPLHVYMSICLILFSPISSPKKPPGATLQISSPWLLRGAGACLADIGRHRSRGRLSLDEEIGSALHDFTQMSVWGSSNVF